MGYFKFKDKNVYYEIEGKGSPIVLLNGIMMSTLSWSPFVTSLSANNTLIRVDFFDQGKTDKLNYQYTQSIQIDLLKELLDHLNIKKANIVGISYGSEVALGFATVYQEYVERLVLFNTTAHTSNWLKDIGRSWIAVGKTRDGNAYYKTTIPIIYSEKFYEKNNEWMKNREKKLNVVFSNPEFLDSLERLTISSESYNLLDEVTSITVPTLIVAANEDSLTPIANQEELHKLISSSHLITIPNCGHASMYEQPLLFVTLILGFINSKEVEYII